MKKNQSNKTIITVAALFTLTFFLQGCASGSGIATGPSYQATISEQIKILTSYPSEYETIGLVEASAPKGYLRKPSVAQNAALTELKKQAAAMGAHAIVVKTYSSTKVPDLSLGDDDELGLIFSTDHKQITGEAIRFK